MVKRERVGENSQRRSRRNPSITDDARIKNTSKSMLQNKSTTDSAARATERIMRRLQEVDRPWLNLLSSENVEGEGESMNLLNLLGLGEEETKGEEEQETKEKKKRDEGDGEIKGEGEGQQSLPMLVINQKDVAARRGSMPAIALKSTAAVVVSDANSTGKNSNDDNNENNHSSLSWLWKPRRSRQLERAGCQDFQNVHIGGST